MRATFLILTFACAIATINAYAIESLDNSLARPRGKRAASPKKIPDYDDYEDYGEDYSDDDKAVPVKETKVDAGANSKGDKKVENTKTNDGKDNGQQGIKDQPIGKAVANLGKDKAQSADDAETEDYDEASVNETDDEKDNASKAEDLESKVLPEKAEKIEPAVGNGPETDKVPPADQEEAIKKAEKELADALADEKIGTDQEVVPGENDVEEEPEGPVEEDADYDAETGSEQAGDKVDEPVESVPVPVIAIQPDIQVAEAEQQIPDAPLPQTNNVPQNVQSQPNIPVSLPIAQPAPAIINVPVRQPIAAPILSPAPASLPVPVRAVDPVPNPAPVAAPIRAPITVPVAAPIPVPPKAPTPVQARAPTVSTNPKPKPPTRVVSPVQPKPAVQRPTRGSSLPQKERKGNVVPRKLLRRIPTPTIKKPIARRVVKN